MNRLRMFSWLLLGTASLANCSERNTPTAPSADAVALNPAGFIGDRPYTWSVKCVGKKYLWSSASWSLTASGVAIDGAGGATTCTPATSPVSGSGTRPATADGFSACVNGICATWPVDPTTGFKAQLNGSYTIIDPSCAIYGGHTNGCKITVSATLTVDS